MHLDQAIIAQDQAQYGGVRGVWMEDQLHFIVQ